MLRSPANIAIRRGLDISFVESLAEQLNSPFGLALFLLMFVAAVFRDGSSGGRRVPFRVGLDARRQPSRRLW